MMKGYDWRRHHDGKKWLADRGYVKPGRAAARKRDIIAANDELHQRQVAAKRRREAA